MAGYLTYVFAFVLAAHGLVHLLGVAVYLEFATVPDLSYKTTLLGGAIDVGDSGMRIYGLLCGVDAVGFVASAGAFLADWHSWRRLLVVVTLFSLGLTILDWTVASAGIAVNLVILGVLVADIGKLR